MDNILTPNKFALIVENIVKDKRISYIDAILEYCKDNEIDPSNTKSMINKTLKEKIAFGRDKALPSCEIVYAVITYAHKEIEGHILRTLETPKQQEKCVLNVLFDYKAIVPKTGV